MTTHFFNETLQFSSSRISTTEIKANLLLDKNEQSEDVQYHQKKHVLKKLLTCDWNRYPTSDYSFLEQKIGDYCNLHPNQIVLASGSATLITTLLNYFALSKKNIIIAQPSYSLFDYHCKTYNIKYTAWLLNQHLEFDYEHLPELNQDSVFIITSPNNPTGNAIDMDKLEYILKNNPTSLIILDNVYAEFSDTDCTPVVSLYPNLIVLRSFSKAFPIAGLRLGYVCAPQTIAKEIKKLILQFSIHPLSLCFASEILFDKAFQQESRIRVQEIISQRKYVHACIRHQFNESTVKVFQSQGNFLLIRIPDDFMFEKLMEDFMQAEIKVLNTSSFTLLNNTFRVSIGTAAENEKFLTCLKNSIESFFQTEQVVQSLRR